jgi:hypothetical protein
MISSDKTREELIADVLTGLVRALADDMLLNRNSGLEDIYTDYVAQIPIDEGSY